MSNKFWQGHNEMMLWMLQVDLAGHSAWVRALPSVAYARQERAHLSTLVTEAVRPHFERVIWAGDGGVFAAPVQAAAGASTATARDCVEAADRVRACFQVWRSAVKRGDMLGLRVSVHVAQIHVHDDPTQWYADELNLFMKHERLVGRADATVLTREVFRRLELDDQTRWRHWREHDDDIPWDLYADMETLDPNIPDTDPRRPGISKVISTWRGSRGIQDAFRQMAAPADKSSVTESSVYVWRDEWYVSDNDGPYISLDHLDRIMDSDSRSEIKICWEGVLPADPGDLSNLASLLPDCYEKLWPLTKTSDDEVVVCRLPLPPLTVGAFLKGQAPMEVARRLSVVVSDVETAIAKLKGRPTEG